MTCFGSFSLWLTCNTIQKCLEDSRQASAITFPSLIYGNGLTAQRVQTPVTVDRIAPTVAKTIRIRAPNACASEPLF